MEIYHKSTCVTCRRALAELGRADPDLKERDFFKDPLSESELTKLVLMTGKRPSELLRKRDKMYKELDLGNSAGSYTDSEMIRLMVRHPGLIMRPIVTVPQKNTAFAGKSAAAEIAGTAGPRQ